MVNPVLCEFHLNKKTSCEFYKLMFHRYLKNLES